MGIDVPVLDGRQGIVDGFAVSVGPMDTVHIATNLRVLYAEGDGARAPGSCRSAHAAPRLNRSGMSMAAKSTCRQSSS
jgi:hypothetical protein